MSETTHTPPPPAFVKYERTVYQTIYIATVTPENVAEIAAWVSGKVDYTGPQPVLTSATGTQFKVGDHVHLTSIPKRSIQNHWGFNRPDHLKRAGEPAWTPADRQDSE